MKVTRDGVGCTGRSHLFHLMLRHLDPVGGTAFGAKPGLERPFDDACRHTLVVKLRDDPFPTFHVVLIAPHRLPV